MKSNSLCVLMLSVALPILESSSYAFTDATLKHLDQEIESLSPYWSQIKKLKHDMEKVKLTLLEAKSMNQMYFTTCKYYKRVSPDFANMFAKQWENLELSTIIPSFWPKIGSKITSEILAYARANRKLYSDNAGTPGCYDLSIKDTRVYAEESKKYQSFCGSKTDITVDNYEQNLNSLISCLIKDLDSFTNSAINVFGKKIPFFNSSDIESTGNDKQTLKYDVKKQMKMISKDYTDLWTSNYIYFVSCENERNIVSKKVVIPEAHDIYNRLRTLNISLQPGNLKSVMGGKTYGVLESYLAANLEIYEKIIKSPGCHSLQLKNIDYCNIKSIDSSNYDDQLSEITTCIKDNYRLRSEPHQGYLLEWP